MFQLLKKRKATPIFSLADTESKRTQNNPAANLCHTGTCCSHNLGYIYDPASSVDDIYGDCDSRVTKERYFNDIVGCFN